MISMDEEHILELKKNFLSIKQLRHSNIIKYHALYFDLKKNITYLVMEHFPFPNLADIDFSDEAVSLSLCRISNLSSQNSSKSSRISTSEISATAISNQKTSSLMHRTEESKSSISASPKKHFRGDRAEICSPSSEPHNFWHPKFYSEEDTMKEWIFGRSV